MSSVNLLLHSPSEADLKRVFAAHPPLPLLPAMGDAAWTKVQANPVAQPWIAAIRKKAIAEADEPMPVLTDALYADFKKTGKRLSFEEPYFERRRRVARAACAVLTEPGGPTRDLLQRSLLAKSQDLFSDPAWCVPEQAKNDTGKAPMQIDLFGAETANLFGELLNLFSPILPAGFQQAVRERLLTQYWNNYLTTDFWWFRWRNNWNAVCHQGVLGSALALSDDAAMLARLAAAVGQRLQVFIGAFGADGSTSEGIGYWGYGFGWFVELNRQLELRTGGELSLFAGDPRIEKIASFGPKMALSHGLTVNFADCSAHATPRPALLTYLAERLNNPMLAERAGVAWTLASRSPISLDGERDDFMRLSRQLLRAPQVIDPAAELREEDIYIESLGLLLSRFKDERGHLWEFAIKAGHNDELHNHNDVGSYILNIDGHRLLTEIGMPEYDGFFFGPKRYEYLAARSLGHPVPLINGQEQAAGVEFAGVMTRKTDTAESAAVEIDLTRAYVAAAGVERCVRSLHIDKRAGVLRFDDRFTLVANGSVETALISEAAVETAGPGIEITAGGRTVVLLAKSGNVNVRNERHDYIDHEGHPAHITRIALATATRDREATITYEIRLK